MSKQEDAKQRKIARRLSAYFKRTAVPSMCDDLDLELAGRGLIMRVEGSIGTPHYRITPEGEKVLFSLKEDERARRRPHHDLGTRLASWLRTQGKVTWENREFFRRGDSLAPCRPDVFSMDATYSEERSNPTVYEVKVSRSDFLADISKPEKRTEYFRWGSRVFYVAPENMLKAEEIPENCGLMEESPDGTWKVTKRAKKCKMPLFDHGFWMRLLLKPGDLPDTF